MFQVIGPVTIVLIVAQFVALGLVIWRILRWRKWLALRQLLLWILFAVGAVMIWNLASVLTTPAPGR